MEVSTIPIEATATLANVGHLSSRRLSPGDHFDGKFRKKGIYFLMRTIMSEIGECGREQKGGTIDIFAVIIELFNRLWSFGGYCVAGYIGQQKRRGSGRRLRRVIVTPAWPFSRTSARPMMDGSLAARTHERTDERAGGQGSNEWDNKLHSFSVLGLSLRPLL